MTYQSILQKKYRRAALKSTGKVKGTLGSDGLTKSVNK
jgi:hypothetical protein